MSLTDATDHAAAKEAFDKATTFLKIVGQHVTAAVAGKETDHKAAGAALSQALALLQGVKKHILAEMMDNTAHHH